MRVIGLTGGIASGKSSVSNILKHYPHVDADQVSRRVVSPGMPGLQQISATFGSKILHEDGRLDRGAMRSLIARDSQAQQQLNAILHPIIIDAIKQELKALEAQGEALAFVSAALMLESGSYKNYDAVILISAPWEIRLKRLLERDGMDRDTAILLMNRQWRDEKRRSLSTCEIINDGSLEDLKARTREALVKLDIDWRD